MDSIDLSYDVLKKTLSDRIDRHENWYMVDPGSGMMWIVPVKDLSKLAFRSGCVIPHVNGWVPEYDAKRGGYIGCKSKEGARLIVPQTLKKGVKVGKGPSWIWGSQCDSGLGIVLEVPPWGRWPLVQWPDGSKNRYRWGYAIKSTSVPGMGVYDLTVMTNYPAQLDMMQPYARVCLL